MTSRPLWQRVVRGAVFFLSCPPFAFAAPLLLPAAEAPVNLHLGTVERLVDRYRVTVEAPETLPNYLVERSDRRIWIRFVGGVSEGSQVFEGDTVIRALRLTQRRHSADLIIEPGPDAASSEVYFEDGKKRLVIDVHVVPALVRTENDSPTLVSKTTPIPSTASAPVLKKVTKKKKVEKIVAANATPAAPAPSPEPKSAPPSPTVAVPSQTEPTVKPLPEPVLRAATGTEEPMLVADHHDQRVIVIDAGHGGVDCGAIGARGTFEKDINLAVAKALAKKLAKQKGFDVIMTREDDTFVPLRDRTQIANKANADLFISIHCNSSLSAKSTGFETYVLAERASDQAAAAVARVENSVVALEKSKSDAPSRLSELLASMAVNEFINESTKFASLLCRHLHDQANNDKTAVNEANFYVLRGARMPAVLVELEYLSNPISELRLRSSRYQNQLVKGLLDGVLAYDHQMKDEKEPVASQYREALTKIDR